MDESIIITKLIVALIAGGIVGLEREALKKPAGIRTHALVCMGSAMLVAVILEQSTGSLAVDSGARIAAGIITGIGFLGAGTIMRSHNRIRGLTTAASIWAISCVGVMIGYGMFTTGIISAIIVWVVLRLKTVKPRKPLIQSINWGMGEK